MFDSPPRHKNKDGVRSSMAELSVVVRVVAGSNPVGHPKIYKLSTLQGIDRINRLLILNNENDEIDKYQKRLKNRRVLMSI